MRGEKVAKESRLSFFYLDRDGYLVYWKFGEFHRWVAEVEEVGFLYHLPFEANYFLKESPHDLSKGGECSAVWF